MERINFQPDLHLNQIDLKGLGAYASKQDWIGADETPTAFEPAGEGNMNLTYRLTTNRRSLILKQSLPWVAKYPQIAAPIDRIETEVAFYRRLAPERLLSSRMPRLLANDTANHLAVFSDLSPAKDLSGVYAEPLKLSTTHAVTAGRWLATLHRLPQPSMWSALLQNRAMRDLNYAHVFEIPFSESMPFSLDDFTPGLEAAARDIRADYDLRDRITALGERFYLKDGPVLLHGDFFPGSLMSAGVDLFVIDPEFCFPGPPEFDLAVFLAHTRLANLSPSIEAAFFKEYTSTGPHVSEDLVDALTSVEILRRLLGVAQLPLKLDLSQKRERIEAAIQVLKGFSVL